MAKKKASFLCLIVQIIILLTELSLAGSTYKLLIVQIASVTDFSTFLPTVGAAWIGIGIISRVLSGVGGWFQLPNVAKNVGWGLVGTLLGGAILLVWLIVAHALAIIRYFFACLFGKHYQASAPQKAQTAVKAEAEKAEDADEESDVKERYLRDLQVALDEIDMKEIDSRWHSPYAVIDSWSLRFSFPWMARHGGTVDVYAEIKLYTGDSNFKTEEKIKERANAIEDELVRAVNKVLEDVNAQYEYKGISRFYTPSDMKYHVSCELK